MFKRKNIKTNSEYIYELTENPFRAIQVESVQGILLLSDILILGLLSVQGNSHDCILYCHEFVNALKVWHLFPNDHTVSHLC